ncbi:type IV pilus assembly protein PilM [Carboxydothermus ferrireducens]|uniref:Type IV pilus assembly protein PilM n=1 Tax=Carboxydothermus ferrireducens DSM 11255 TaxID=1119529 RepID=A0ABX2R7H6_9THEO|nr:type IV pilus assembly protein PilM [Carboxydothermus ferrireducens]NYE56512.1 type IV pilus assembly protein PilM [Carboxydothermus ferrireducens DSM 11255]
MQSFIGKFMGKNRYILAFDAGVRYFKAVLLKADKKQPELLKTVTYQMPVEFQENTVRDYIPKYLLAAKKEFNIGKAKVITTLPGNKIISRIIKVPLMNQKELNAYLDLEAEQYLPVPVKDSVLASVILENAEADDGTRQMNVLLSAASREIIMDLYDTVVSTGLNLDVVDLPFLALYRAVFSQINLEIPVAVVDIGAGNTLLIIVKDGILKFVRSIKWGANAITQMIATNMNLDFVKAEQLKEEKGELLAIDEHVVDQEKLTIDISIRQAISELINEIRRSIDFYRTQERGNNVERILITGGGSKLKGLTELFESQLDLETFTFAPMVEEKLDPAFTLAYGLGLWGVERDV